MKQELKNNNYRLGIGLFGKGSTNHLHRREVVEAFSSQGVDVRFLVREDYKDILNKIKGCHYSSVLFNEDRGLRRHLNFVCGYIRQLYPIQDPGRKSYFKLLSKYKNSKRFRIFDVVYKFFARFKSVMNGIVLLEGLLSRQDTVQGIDPESIDQLLLLGVGTASSELEGHMVWWARRNNIPFVNIIGNYDNLTSKGFRGVPVERLLVWGPNMRDDAINYHDISSDRITEIGPIRYSINSKLLDIDRREFVQSIGLDPDKKTILFAGFFFEFHYFEMMEAYKQLLADGVDCQLILRLYPNKILMSSVFMTSFIDYAERNKGVYLSIGDPNYKKGAKGKSVLQIEEYELWNSLNACDCVINIFSTISLEACIFDTPAINMYYFQEPFPGLARSPLYYDYEKLFHSRRLVSYGAIKTTRNRTKLIKAIKHAFENPLLLQKERKKTVELECGSLDSDVCSSLVKAVVQEFQQETSSLH